MLFDANGLEVYCCTPRVFRVVWKPNHNVFDPCEETTWSVVGTQRNAPRFSAQGTPRADVLDVCFGGGATENVSDSPLRVSSINNGTPSRGLAWHCKNASGEWVALHEDLHYRQDDEDGSSGLGNALVHRFVRRESDAYLGLGETSGSLNKQGRRYRIRATDCMGYNARTADPLYKHLPFLIVFRQDIQQYYGIFYDTTHESVVDLGCEANNYYGPYSMFATRSKSLDYYFIAGPTLADVVQTFSTSVVGTVPRQPAWSFGYLGSAMGYTDDPRGVEALLIFLQECRSHQVVCTGFYMSSGYSMGDDGLRYVFEWNKRRFPDPKSLTTAFHEAGVKLIANIKPAMLTSHPSFDTATTADLFVRDKHDASKVELTTFWGGPGAHLNFLNCNTRDYWAQRVEKDLLEHGIDTTWNDNNEYTEVSGSCAIVEEGTLVRTVPARGVRCVQTLLMTGTSFETQCRHNAPSAPLPTLSSEGVPPAFVVARSGMYGSHRIASTWTGDNYTSWETLVFNIPMGLGLALSGWSNIGHDIGGFSGPVPAPELMYRWCQQGLFHPRYTIHSWKIGHSENSPWMYDKEDSRHTQRLAALTQFRFRMIPWLVQLNTLASSEGIPMIAPLLYYHPFTSTYVDRYDMFYFGPNVIVIPPLQEGVDEWDVPFFPEGEWWSLDGRRHFIHDTPTSVRVVAPREPHDVNDIDGLLPPVFVRAGSIIPLLAQSVVPRDEVVVGLRNEDDPALSKVELRCYPSTIDAALDWTQCKSVSPDMLTRAPAGRLPLNGDPRAQMVVVSL